MPYVSEVTVPMFPQNGSCSLCQPSCEIVSSISLTSGAFLNPHSMIAKERRQNVASCIPFGIPRACLVSKSSPQHLRVDSGFPSKISSELSNLYGSKKLISAWRGDGIFLLRKALPRQKDQNPAKTPHHSRSASVSYLCHQHVLSVYVRRYDFFFSGW